MLRAEAALAVAIERVLARDYAGAAKALQATDREQATALEQLARIQRRGDKLELARALRQRKESLVTSMDPSTYGGYSGRYGILPPASEEAKNLVRYLEAAFGSFQALQPLVEWLEQHPKAPNARSVLKEADAAYIELGTYGDGWRGLFWDGYLKQHELAVRLRRVGKQIRQPKPAP